MYYENNYSNSDIFFEQYPIATNEFSLEWAPSSTIIKSDIILNIFFQDFHHKNLINVVTTWNTKIKDLIESYFYKINRPNLAVNNENQVKFKFNGKYLKINDFPNETIKDIGIMNGDILQVFFNDEKI